MFDEKFAFVLGSFVVACSAKVNRLPVTGESLRASALTVEPGGKGFNLAVGLRRLGVSVDGLMAVGDDLFGDLALAAMAQAGLPEVMVRRYPGATGSGIGFTEASGENCLAVHPGANALLSAADVEAAAGRLRRSALVLAQFEIADEPIRAAFGLARSAGIPTLLNPSPWRPIEPETLASTTILVLNRVEAASMARAEGRNVPFATADDAADWATMLLARGPELVVVTLGGEGAVAVTRDGARHQQAAIPVDVVDTLGAGDAFAAGLGAGVLTDLSLHDSLRQAAVCGSLVCRGCGVIRHLPTQAAVKASIVGVDQP